MIPPNKRSEYVEVSAPQRKWFWRVSRREAETFDRMFFAISEKCRQVAPDGWTLTDIEAIPESHLSGQYSLTAARLHFERPAAIDRRDEWDRVFEKLDRVEFKARMKSSFATVYMTTTSIIQGVALAILAQQTFGIVAEAGVSNFAGWAQVIPYGIVSLVIAITVASEYSWFIGVYRWSAGFTDAMFPFALGATQIGATYFMTEPRTWWFVNSLFSFIGALAYLHTMWRSEADMFEDSRVWDHNRRTALTAAGLCFLVSALALSMAFVYRDGRTVKYWNVWDLVPTGIYLVMLVILLRREATNVRKMHALFGVRR